MTECLCVALEDTIREHHNPNTIYDHYNKDTNKDTRVLQQRWRPMINYRD